MVTPWEDAAWVQTTLLMSSRRGSPVIWGGSALVLLAQTLVQVMGFTKETKNK